MSASGDSTSLRDRLFQEEEESVAPSVPSSTSSEDFDSSETNLRSRKHVLDPELSDVEDWSTDGELSDSDDEYGTTVHTPASKQRHSDVGDLDFSLKGVSPFSFICLRLNYCCFGGGCSVTFCVLGLCLYSSSPP